METTVKERLKEFLKEIKIGQNSFEKKIGWSNGYINNVNSISSDKLCLIINEYPQLNIEWLITGKGEMFKGIDGGEVIKGIEGKDLTVDDLRRGYLERRQAKLFFDYLTDKNHSYSASEIASELDMTANQLNKELEKRGVLVKLNEKWILAEEYVGNNYQVPYSNGDRNNPVEYMRWTANGRLFIHSLFNSDLEKEDIVNITPVDENFLLGRLEFLAKNNGILETENKQLKEEVKHLKNIIAGINDNKPYKVNAEQLKAAEPGKE